MSWWEHVDEVLTAADVAAVQRALHTDAWDETSLARSPLAATGAGAAAGAASFQLGTRLWTHAMRLARLSSFNALARPVAGLGAAASAAVACVAFSAGCQAYCRHFSVGAHPIPGWRSLERRDVAFASLATLVFFKTSPAPRRWAAHGLIPSSLFRPGTFARPGCSLPATSDAYASMAAKEQLQVWGRRDGCHHCGYRQRPADRYIGDHIPPNKKVKMHEERYAGKQGAWAWLASRVSPPPPPQAYYAQCQPCAQRQAVACRVEAGQGRRLSDFVVPHWTRAWVVWPPYPLAWLALKPVWLGAAASAKPAAAALFGP